MSHNFPKIPANLRKGLVKEVAQELFNDGKSHAFPSDMLFTYSYKPFFCYDSQNTVDLIFEYLKDSGCFQECSVGNFHFSNLLFLVDIKVIDYRLLKELILYVDFITGNLAESKKSSFLELGDEIYIDPETFFLKIKDSIYDETSSETLNARGLIYLILSKKTEEIKDRKSIAKVLIDSVREKKKQNKKIEKEDKFLNNAVTKVNNMLRESGSNYIIPTRKLTLKLGNT